MKLLFFAIIAGILVAGTVPTAWGSAQLNAFIDPNKDTSPFDIKYQRTALIDYDNGGRIADILRGNSDSIEIAAVNGDPDVEDFKSRLSASLLSSGSTASIDELNVSYKAELKGNPTSASLSYTIELEGTLQDYVITRSDQQATLDMEWRDLTLLEPVTIQGTEINLPISALETLAPDVIPLLDSEARALMNIPIIDATQIGEQTFPTWHFLFDPTGINVAASQFGLSEDIAGFVVSSYTMGESSIREGIKVEVEKEAAFTADTEYNLRTLESSDSGNIDIIGFSSHGNLDGAEIVGVTPRAPEGYGNTSTGDFPVFIIYGMAGLAAIGGIAFFVFSNRALKKEEGMGQQGIDPSLLTAYQTSTSAGGYKTNRAEAQLTSNTDYNQHRSVYDEKPEQEEKKDAPASRGALPKGWD